MLYSRRFANLMRVSSIRTAGTPHVITHTHIYIYKYMYIRTRLKDKCENKLFSKDICISLCAMFFIARFWKSGIMFLVFTNREIIN
jgi:predicted ABC-type exoprotein transport system permease subunit